MLTKHNLKFAFEDLSAEHCKEINEKGDYLKFELHIFNVGGYCTIESCDYSGEVEEELNNSGNLLIDKSDFLMLYDESGANNEFLNEYI